MVLPLVGANTFAVADGLLIVALGYLSCDFYFGGSGFLTSALSSL